MRCLDVVSVEVSASRNDQRSYACYHLKYRETVPPFIPIPITFDDDDNDVIITCARKLSVYLA